MRRIPICFLSLLLTAGTMWAVCREAAAPASTKPQYEADPRGYVIEPEDDFQLGQSSLEDLLPALSPAAPVERTSYTLLEGASHELSVTHICGAGEGPILYVVAGLHGDERAGWYAATLLQDAAIHAGELYVLARANPWGAENGERTTRQKMDVNRRFPGSPEGSDAEQIAEAIFQDIGRVHPVLVLDLHEARILREGRDFLGNSLILGQTQGIEELLLNLWDDANQFSDAPFSFFSGAPEGSLNAVVGKELQIPVISVETFRGDPLSQRVRRQLQVLLYVLKKEGVLLAGEQVP